MIIYLQIIKKNNIFYKKNPDKIYRRNFSDSFVNIRNITYSKKDKEKESCRRSQIVEPNNNLQHLSFIFSTRYYRFDL